LDVQDMHRAQFGQADKLQGLPDSSRGRGRFHLEEAAGFRAFESWRPTSAAIAPEAISSEQIDGS